MIKTPSLIIQGLTRLTLLMLAFALSGPPAQAEGGRFNRRGHILIADQFNNRVIEVNRDHQIVWTFGDGSQTAGAHSVVAPNDAERVGGFTLISGTGAPAGTDGYPPDGSPDNRVLLVDPGGHIVWQYGQAGVAGADFDQLSAPVCAVWLPDRHVLITDQGNQRVIETDLQKTILWQYGMTGATGTDPDQLNNPNSAELLENGHILIADEGNNRVLEVTRKKEIVWQYGTPSDPSILNAPAFASRLPDGNTLISDSGNNRVVEVTPAGQVAWTFVTNTRAGSVANPTPTRAVRLRNGHTLISDQFNHQVIEVDPAGDVVFSQGQIGVPGSDAMHLNAPYDAKAIGDYTGLTPPFSEPEDDFR